MSEIKTYHEEYENLLLLGRGGNAEAYLARHKEFKYICTVRRLLEPVKDEKAEKYQKFINECRRLLLLDSGGHAHIARISKPQLLYHTDNKANMACVEMEYIKGENIYDFMKRNNNFIQSDEVVNFVRNIGSALSYCHFDAYEFLADKDVEYTYKLDSKLKGQTFRVKTDLNDGNKLDITPLQEQELISLFKVTHNDIHEGNIIRKCDGNYILIDFGLAAFGHEGARSSINRQGAREYWAPERFDEVFSEQTDIYSFGILTYQMLTGQLPFVYRKEDKVDSHEGEESQLWRKHANQPIPAIEPLRRETCEAAGKKWTGKDYPEWLEQVIMKCLEKKPENRYANGKELYEDVKSHIEKENKRQVEVKVVEKIVKKYIEVPVEKIVEKEVIIKEPIETIVEKEVIKKVTNPFWVMISVLLFLIGSLLASKIMNAPPSEIQTLRQLNEKEAEVNKLNEQVADLVYELAQKGNNPNTQKIIKDKDKEIANLKQQLASIQSNNSNISDLQKKIKQLEADKESLRKQLTTAKNSNSNTADLQREITQLKTDKESLQKQLITARNSNSNTADLQREITQLKADKNTKDAEIARLKKALDAALKEL